MVDNKEIFNILPVNLRKKVLELDFLNKLQEIRLKIGKPVFLQICNEEKMLDYKFKQEDMKIILQKMSNFSMYSLEQEIKQGYITIGGGHRVGIAGRCILDSGKVKTINNIGSLNIRICRQVLNCSIPIIKHITEKDRILNTIIISPPKCGKTTLIRDLAKNISNGVKNINFRPKKVCIVDERSEIAASFNGIPQLDIGVRTDVLDNCPKSQGIIMAIRSLSPDVIICDEIGTQNDVESIICALNSGINLITTIHGFGIEDFLNRKVFKEAIDNKVFKRALVLSCRKSAGTLEYVYDFETQNKIWGV